MNGRWSRGRALGGFRQGSLAGRHTVTDGATASQAWMCHRTVEARKLEDDRPLISETEESRKTGTLHPYSNFLKSTVELPHPPGSTEAPSHQCLGLG